MPFRWSKEVVFLPIFGIWQCQSPTINMKNGYLLSTFSLKYLFQVSSKDNPDTEILSLLPFRGWLCKQTIFLWFYSSCRAKLQNSCGEELMSLPLKNSRHLAVSRCLLASLTAYVLLSMFKTSFRMNIRKHSTLFHA